MDFQEILEQADYNAAVNHTEGKRDTIKRYSSVLPPPKKLSKSNVQSDSIKRFLEKRKAEAAAKAAERMKEKERLLALRGQNSKNNKKAKIMASRTKDNDFSRIKMTDDEKEALKRREAEILRKNLTDKAERMKVRLEMDEKEKLMPKKRKRKSKNSEVVENMIDHDDLRNGYNESTNIKNTDRYQPEKEKVRKPKPPPQPSMTFTDLLKIAEKRQVEPVEIVFKKKEEEKLMTKRERKMMEEEQARLKRKKEKQLQQSNGLSKPSNSMQASTINKKNVLEKEENKKPVVIHVKSEQDAKFKIPKSSVNTAFNNKISSSKHKDNNSVINSKLNSSSNSSNKSLKSPLVNEHKKIKKPKDGTGTPIKGEEIKKKMVVHKKNESKPNPVQLVPKKQAPELDGEALKADIERKVQERLTKEREKLEKEIEEKIAAKFAQFQNMQSKEKEKVPETPKQIKKEPAVEVKNPKKIIEKNQSKFYKKDMERMIAMRKEVIEKSSLKPKLPEKTFHKNPYLDPPRRLLEPQRPPRPSMKRRIESDDEDDDDDDDMNDFIDDGPSQNEEDYSKYIREIFGYDRNRYKDDDDDDDIMESTFEQQMKEEVKSARLGYLEDLEEERLEMERRKKKKIKK